MTSPLDPGLWTRVYFDYRRGCQDGTFARILHVLRGWVRPDMGREATPSAALRDSQSVQTTEQGELRGYDAGQQVKGRKRRHVVDIEAPVDEHSAPTRSEGLPNRRGPRRRPRNGTGQWEAGKPTRHSECDVYV